MVRWASGGSMQNLQILVVARTIHNLAEDFRAFGIVVGRTAGQHQLQFGVVGFQQPICFDDAQRILEPIEPRDLQ